jgi:hypothetical protein
MKPDPICGMNGAIAKSGYGFCSEHCIKAYEEGKSAKPWYRETLTIIIAVILAFLALASAVPALHPFLIAFNDYVALVWWAVLLGLLIGGVIDRFVPHEYISKFLAQPRRQTIVNAALLGFLMSACSHGILAIAIQLYKKGASVPAVITFLMAAPWASLPVTILLFSFFGLKTFAILLAALVIAILSGFFYQFLDRKGLIERGLKPVAKEFSITKDVRKRWKAYSFNAANDIGGVLRGARTLSKMVLGWILIGVTLASVARAFVPEEIFHHYMGVSIVGMLVTLLLATIIEVCSEGSSPMAFEIYSQTGAFGNSFLFLMAGVATDYTEIGLIWQNIGKKAALWLPAVTVPQILLVAYVFNALL